jgi:phosphotransferase system enzyme I (PtsI)
MRNWGPDREICISGLALSGGVAFARACLVTERRHSDLVVYKVEEDDAEAELIRLKVALDVVAERLEEIRRDIAQKIGTAEAEIFVAQRMILLDRGLNEQISEAILSRGLSAELAVVEVLDSHEDRISEVDNTYIKERATDFGEVKRRILDALRDMNPSLQCRGQAHCPLARDRVVIAEELTPDLTIDLDPEHTRAFVTERGGPGSHAAILARALGIPAVSGIQQIHSRILCGTELLVDGDTGEVIIWPEERTLAVRQTLTATVPPPHVIDTIEGLQVMASISSWQDAEKALEMKADGIGLYRTEFEFLAAHQVLSEEDQFQRYASVVKAMKGKPVYFRLLDIGADKSAPFLDLPKQENPDLGLRGARLLAARPELLRSQARALARASAFGPINVIYPMIEDLAQFLGLKKNFQDAVRSIEPGEIKHGVMLEVPSACLQAREILEHADFGSIGSNDLVQYLFAVDRNNDLVASGYSPDRAAFWSLLDSVVRAANDTGRPLSVCGEMAGDPRYVGKLLAHGITRVSVSSRLIPGVRLEARNHLT